MKKLLGIIKYKYFLLWYEIDLISLSSPFFVRFKYTYEDCMELLANLPAIIGLVAKAEILSNVNIDGDWIQVLVNYLVNVNEDFDCRKSSIEDFLRLYVTLNA